MQIKKFRATDIKMALKLVKDELGPDAVILSTKKVKGEGSGYGLFGRPIIEVTAASDDRYTTDMIRKDNGHTSNIPLYLS
ncbi:MAG: flagellar biosynthesis protein FlhF, partial [Nitrospinae bacterium]|nr:flagellar biosynthesis protein FlhF [Nitrospinota bacterium]